MVIDSHVHVFDRSVPGARDNFPLWPGNAWGAGGADLIQQMDEAGIDRSVLISYTPTDVMAHYHPDQRDQDKSRPIINLEGVACTVNS